MTKLNYIRTQLNSPFSTPDFLDKSYYPSLDGWRAVAVVLVIGEHLKNNIGSNSIYAKIASLVFFGRLGVDIFFVLSGFLITSILLKEKIKTGKINIGRFFLRRVLRIFPVLYLYLICCFLLNQFFQPNIAYISFIWPAICVSNIIYSDPMLAHTWTLSVEEQYYLFWPVTLNFFKYPVLLYLVLIILLPIAKIIIYYNSTNFNVYFEHIYIPATTILTGSIAAIISFKKIIQQTYFKASLFIISILLVFIIFYLQNHGLFGIIMLPFGTLISNLLIAYAIIYSLNCQEHTVVKFLNHPITIKIGLTSYSIYIWQQLFLQPNGTYHQWQKLAFFPVNLLLIGVKSYLSYHYYEGYFLRLKVKYIK